MIFGAWADVRIKVVLGLASKRGCPLLLDLTVSLGKEVCMLYKAV